jgi:hypothetical protein
VNEPPGLSWRHVEGVRPPRKPRIAGTCLRRVGRTLDRLPVRSSRSRQRRRITYLTEEAGLVERTVTLPWTSQEFLAARETSHVEAHGPPGSNLRCVVRYRRINGAYGGDGSGSAVGYEERSDDGQTRCSAGTVHAAPGA